MGHVLSQTAEYQLPTPTDTISYGGARAAPLAVRTSHYSSLNVIVQCIKGCRHPSLMPTASYIGNLHPCYNQHKLRCATPIGGSLVAREAICIGTESYWAWLSSICMWL